MELINEFQRACQEEMAFLVEEFGFGPPDVEVDRFGAELRYKNATTGITVRLEPRENRIFVMLYRLVGGEFPHYHSVHERDADLSNNFDLDDLIALRCPSLSVAQPFNEWLTGPRLREVLVGYARALRECASDVLAGNFRIFTDLGEIVAKRLSNLDDT